MMPTCGYFAALFRTDFYTSLLIDKMTKVRRPLSLDGFRRYKEMRRTVGYL
jgi:hypothetical protein